MDLDLANRSFIVTGGTDGLGLATARCLLAEGATVLVTGRTDAKFHRMREELCDAADRIDFLAGNNADPDLPERLRRAVIERRGRLDGLLVSVGGPPAGAALSTDDAAWRDAFESVFLGAVRLVRDLSGTMADGSAIVLVLAVSAREAAPMFPISSGLRPGLALLAKNFAVELGSRGIRVNTLLPGMFGTGRMRAQFAEEGPPVDHLPLRRIGEPEEFGRMATVLLSRASSYVTGAAIAVDGGHTKVL
ncbi:MAG: SDR family oxidoreductase [Gluconacetobacter diazotrophicus]|nr:SDR family oxidoreductase [Gluconacetobacter diazotrophicus]